MPRTRQQRGERDSPKPLLDLTHTERAAAERVEKSIQQEESTSSGAVITETHTAAESIYNTVYSSIYSSSTAAAYYE